MIGWLEVGTFDVALESSFCAGFVVAVWALVLEVCVHVRAELRLAKAYNVARD